MFWKVFPNLLVKVRYIYIYVYMWFPIQCLFKLNNKSRVLWWAQIQVVSHFFSVWYDSVWKRIWCRVFEACSSLARAGWSDFAWPSGCLIGWLAWIGCRSARRLSGHGWNWTQVTRKADFAQIRYGGAGGAHPRAFVMYFTTLSRLRGVLKYL